MSRMQRTPQKAGSTLSRDSGYSDHFSNGGSSTTGRDDRRDRDKEDVVVVVERDIVGAPGPLRQRSEQTTDRSSHSSSILERPPPVRSDTSNSQQVRFSATPPPRPRSRAETPQYDYYRNSVDSGTRPYDIKFEYGYGRFGEETSSDYHNPFESRRSSSTRRSEDSSSRPRSEYVNPERRFVYPYNSSSSERERHHDQPPPRIYNPSMHEREVKSRDPEEYRERSHSRRRGRDRRSRQQVDTDRDHDSSDWDDSWNSSYDSISERDAMRRAEARRAEKLSGGLARDETLPERRFSQTRIYHSARRVRTPSPPIYTSRAPYPPSVPYIRPEYASTATPPSSGTSGNPNLVQKTSTGDSHSSNVTTNSRSTGRASYSSENTTYINEDGELEGTEITKTTTIAVDGDEKASHTTIIQHGGTCWITFGEDPTKTPRVRVGDPSADVEENLISLEDPNQASMKTSPSSSNGTISEARAKNDIERGLYTPFDEIRKQFKKPQNKIVTIESIEDDTNLEETRQIQSENSQDEQSAVRDASKSDQGKTNEGELIQIEAPVKRKTVTFDPYSSEDLEIFNSCIKNGDGTFLEAFQVLQSKEKKIEGASARPFAYSPEKKQDLAGSLVKRFECIITGCSDSFDTADNLAQHAFEHGIGWKFARSASRTERSSSRPRRLSSVFQDDLNSEDDRNDLNDEYLLQAIAGTQDTALVDSASVTSTSRRRMISLDDRYLSPQSQAKIDLQSQVEESSNTDSEIEYDLKGLLPTGAKVAGKKSLSLGDIRIKSTQSSWWKMYLRETLNGWLRPRKAFGKTRVEWTCGCGETLYSDFTTKENEVPNKWSAITQTPNSSSAPPVWQPPQLQMPPPILSEGSHARSISSGSSFSRSDSRSSGSRSLTTTDASSVSSAGGEYRTATFLELCVNTGEHLATLGEIDLTDAKCDGDLFGAIRERYLSIRGYRSKFWLLKPCGLSFVRFSVEQRHRVGILQTPLAVPPKSEVDAKRWIYDPCPLDGDPPIPEHLFLHYLQCKSRSKNLFWLLRLPRKLKTSILENGIASAALGWGIHIQEGPDYGVVFLINLVGLVVSGLFGTLWTVYMHDFQGAFGFACWVIATLNALMAAFIYRWRAV